jgi:hypothetical protein
MKMYTISKVLEKVDCKYGAPMGRSSFGVKPETTKVFDRKVPMCSCCGAYDKGGVYWGLGKQLRVQYTKDLSYVNFYRV